MYFSFLILPSASTGPGYNTLLSGHQATSVKAILIPYICSFIDNLAKKNKENVYIRLFKKKKKNLCYINILFFVYQ